MTRTRTRSLLASGALATAVVVAGAGRSRAARGEAAAAAPAAPAFATFEAAAAGAVPAGDLVTLLAPLAAQCDQANDLARRQCEGLRAYTKALLEGQAFAAFGDERALAVGAYDAKLKGVPLGVTGCVACAAPLVLGSGGSEPRFVVSAPPGADQVGERGIHASPLAKIVVPFASPAAASDWTKSAAPFLRVALVFKIVPTAWEVGAARGFTATVLAQRVYDRCTGQIVESFPPAKTGQTLDVRGESQGCPAPKAAEEVAVAKPAPLPARLSSDAIQAGLQSARADVSKCYDTYRVPGQLQVAATVAGSDGKVIAVKVLGSFAATPTGACVVQAVKKVVFPRFAEETQIIRLPFYLR